MCAHRDKPWHVHIFMYTHTIQAHAQAHTRPYMYIFPNTQMHTHVHAFAYTVAQYTHTNMHTHIHTQRYVCIYMAHTHKQKTLHAVIIWGARDTLPCPTTELLTSLINKISVPCWSGLELLLHQLTRVRKLCTNTLHLILCVEGHAQCIINPECLLLQGCSPTHMVALLMSLHWPTNVPPRTRLRGELRGSCVHKLGRRLMHCLRAPPWVSKVGALWS